MLRQTPHAIPLAPTDRRAARLPHWLATPGAALLALGLSGGILLGHLFYYLRLIGFDAVDDAYISFRYAANWAHGLGPVFNAGERVEGYTNFLWTALLSGAARLGLDIPAVSLVLGAALALATLALLWHITRRDAQNAALLAPFLLAADGSFALWAVSGLETALYGFLVFAAAVALSREIERGGFPYSGILFALAAMARPDGVLIFALSMVYLLAVRLLKSYHRRELAADAGRILLFAGLFGAYFLWRYRYYGFLLPNTFYAKVEMESPTDQINRGFAHLQTFLNVHYGPIVPALMAVPFIASIVARLRRRPQDADATPATPRPAGPFPQGYALLLVLGYCAYIVYVGGDWSIGRFFVPILPFAYLLAAQGLGHLFQAAGLLLRRRAATLSTVAILVLGTALSLAFAYRSSYRGERELYALPFEVRLASQSRKAAGEWLRRNAPPDALLLVDAAGQMPYYSGLRSIDLFGLTDAYLAHQRITVGKGTPGHEKVDINYLFSRRPDYIVIYGRAFDGNPDFVRVQGWTTDAGFERFLSIYRRR